MKQELTSHPMYTPSDLAYFRAKGYTDEEIRAFWDRDANRGCGPVHHALAPKIVEYLNQ